MAPVFPPGHTWPNLRGYPIPDSSAVCRAIRKMAARLEHRIADRAIDLRPVTAEMGELAALAVVLRLFEEYRVSDTEPPSADDGGA